MASTTDTWPEIIDRIFEGFLTVEDATPDWLEVPGMALQLGVDILYPELGIAIYFKLPGNAHQQRNSALEGVRADLCRKANIALIVVGGESEARRRTLAEIHAALSASARRVAQQRGARQAKLDLLPRIAAAKATCQRILEDVSASPSPLDTSQRQKPPPQAQPNLRLFMEKWQIQAQKHLATLSSVLAALPTILKHLVLFAAVLFAVNAVSYLVANFLDLRGPMAYNYVPDTKVPIADVFETYPDYLQGVLSGEFGTMRLNQLRGRLFAIGEVPILDLVLERLARSLVLLGLAVTFSIVVGLTAGFLSVNYRTRRTNPLALIISLAGFSMPGFYVGILIVYLMIWAAMNHGKGVFFLPTTGYGLDRHLILPVLALAARPTAEIARLTAELLGEELPKDYIRVARAKGLPEQQIITRHAFRNVMAAVINAMSNSWSYVIGSLVIIERVFAWGGIGEALIDSVTFSQYAGSSFNPALVATLATSVALLFLLTDFVTGLIAKALDPRLRGAGGGAA
jgi:peptide/nickel transport system permease protein